MDDRKIALSSDEMGTVSITSSLTAGGIGRIGDKVPTAAEEVYDITDGTDYGQASQNISSTNQLGWVSPDYNGLVVSVGYTALDAAADSSWTLEYDASSLMDGLAVTLAYTPSDGTVEIESSTSYAAAYTGIEGLTIGAGAGEDNGAAASIDVSTMYVKYAMDAFTVGYQASEEDSETANADQDFSAMGVSMAVTEELTIALNSSSIDYESSSKSDQEALGISASYTMGSMTFAFAHNTIDNVAGTSTNDRSGYDLNLAFAF